MHWLTLALTQTEFFYGSFRVEYVDNMYSSDRLRAMLIANQGIDVLFDKVPALRRARITLKHFKWPINFTDKSSVSYQIVLNSTEVVSH